METKFSIRQYYRALRRQISVEKEHAASQALVNIFLDYFGWMSRDDERVEQKNIAVYLACDGEINLQPLIEALWQLQHNIFLPVIDVDTQTLRFVQYHSLTSMKKNQYGIEEPENISNYLFAEDLDIVLMPLVAFDYLGFRLGMGKGFYDKSVKFCREQHDKPLLIGVAYTCQSAQELPIDPWDVPLDGVLTEKELLMFPEETMSQQYLAFDFGTQYIGVAIGQDVTQTARPLTTLKQQGKIPDWNAIKKLIIEWSPTAIIVGIPIHDDGPNQWITEKAKAFATQLALETKCIVHTIDERLSTVEARQALFEQGGYRSLAKEAVDAMAAKVILETWLQSR